MTPRRLSLVLLLAACQRQYSITEKPPEVDDPVETDVPPPVEPTLLPDIEVLPGDEIQFGAFPVDCAAAPQEVTIRNVGAADLDVTAVRFDAQFGLDAFTLTATPQVLAPGEAMTATLTFTPRDMVTYDRIRLKVDSNDPDEPVVRVDVFGEGAENATYEQAWTQVQARDVDVLWVVDNSGSMSDDLVQLNNAIGTFISAFTNLGLDYHIAVTTTDTLVENGRFLGAVITPQSPDPIQAFRAQVNSAGDLGSADEAGLDASYRALTNASLLAGPNAGFLRTDANLAVVVISDEDDYSQISVPDYNRWLNNFKGDPTRTSFSGMVGPDSGGLTACSGVGGGGSASAAPRYHTAIRQTVGSWGDFCSFQITPFLSFLSSLAAGLEYKFVLDYAPNPIGQIEVLVDGVAIPYGLPNGWTYDANANAVLLNGSSVPQPGADIVISYPYQTTCN